MSSTSFYAAFLYFLHKFAFVGIIHFDNTSKHITGLLDPFILENWNSLNKTDISGLLKDNLVSCILIMFCCCCLGFRLVAMFYGVDGVVKLDPLQQIKQHIQLYLQKLHPLVKTMLSYISVLLNNDVFTEITSLGKLHLYPLTRNYIPWKTKYIKTFFWNLDFNAKFLEQRLFINGPNKVQLKVVVMRFGDFFLKKILKKKRVGGPNNNSAGL
ncbi:hypothetical protein ACJX0J_013986 [Zea mays]